MKDTTKKIAEPKTKTEAKDNPVSGEHIEILTYDTRSKRFAYIGTVTEDGLKALKKSIKAK